MATDGSNRYRPDDDLRAVLERDGVVVIAGGVDPVACERAVEDVGRFKARNRAAIVRNFDDRERIYRVVNLHAVIDSLADVFCENAALALGDQFFDAETTLYTSLFFERGSQQSLHRDSPLFATRPDGRYLGVWVALEDTDADNGPLIGVRGSHALPPIDVDALAREIYGDPSLAPANDDAAWDAYQTAVQEQAAAAGLVAEELHVRRGDVIVWHPLLLHGGAVQRDPTRTRASIVFHVIPYEIAIYGQDVFFDREKPVPSTIRQPHVQRGGRQIIARDQLDFNHEFTVRIRDLQRPDAGLAERLAARARATKRRLRG